MSESGTRLNKFLASCGVGSRRACDLIIKEGRVTLNGAYCSNPATRVQPGDSVKLGSRHLQQLEAHTIAFHKPRGLVCTRRDEEGKGTIYDILPPRLHPLAHAGRLDRDSEGLLILTSDGDLAQALTHPAKKVEKLYHVTFEHPFENSILDQFTTGVRTPEGKAKAVAVKRLSARRMEIILNTGLKRQIRLMAQCVGHRVKRLVRIRIGELSLGNLAVGKFSPLGETEIALLLQNPPRAQKPPPVER